MAGAGAAVVGVGVVGMVGRSTWVAVRGVDLAAGVAAGAARDDQACINDRSSVDARGKAAVLGSGNIQVGDAGVSATVAARTGT
jgi:hypothetical protein